LDLTDVVPPGSNLHQALVIRARDFSFYSFDIATTEADYSTQKWQQGMIFLWDTVNLQSKVLRDSGVAYLLPFLLWAQPEMPNWKLDKDGRVCDPTNFFTKGKCGAKVNCTAITNDRTLILDGKKPFLNKTDFHRCLNEWINSDLYYDLLTPQFPLVDTFAPKGNRTVQLNAAGKMTYSRGTFLTQDLNTNDDFVILINQIRTLAKHDNSAGETFEADTATFPSFPKGEPIDFWDQYVTLVSVISTAIVLAVVVAWVLFIVVIFLVSKADADIPIKKRLLYSFWQASICASIIACSVIEIWGLMCLFGIKISAIPTISIIMASGVCVDAICYISMGYMNSPGTRTERVIAALDLMFAPTVDGAILTFLGVLCLSASPFPFIVKYFFVVWVIMVLVTLFNAIVSLPAILSFVGPPQIYSGSGATKSIVGQS